MKGKGPLGGSTASSSSNMERERRLGEAFPNIAMDQLHGFHLVGVVMEGQWSSPLHVSALKGELDTVRDLLELENVRAHVNEAMHGGLTALHLSVQQNHLDIAQRLVLNGAIDQADSSGQVALHYAAEKGNLEMVKVLPVQNYEPFQLALALSSTIGVDGHLNGLPNINILDDKWNDRISIAEEIVGTHKVSKAELSKLLAKLNSMQNTSVKDAENIWKMKKVLEDALEKEEVALLREMFRNVENVRAMANGIMVTAALFATVAFTGFLSPPRGTVSQSTVALQAFFVMNSLSFYFAVTTVLASLSMLTPSGEELKTSNINSILHSITYVSLLLLPVVIFGVGSFASAGFAALPDSYAAVNIFTCVVGILISLVAFSTFIFYKILPIWRAVASQKESSLESEKKSDTNKNSESEKNSESTVPSSSNAHPQSPTPQNGIKKRCCLQV